MQPGPAIIKARAKRAFTLVELLTTVAILLILIGILTPTITRAKQYANKAGCSSNLRQIGTGITMYLQDYNDKFPTARYMPPPFISTSPYPGLPTVLINYIPQDSKVYKCPGDSEYVYKVCGCSYVYNTTLSGEQLENSIFVSRFEYSPTEIPVSHDCDGYKFELEGGSSIIAPMFHARRNVLFADWHVGNYEEVSIEITQ